MSNDAPVFEALRTLIKHQQPDRVPASEIRVEPIVKQVFLRRPINIFQYDRVDLQFPIRATGAD